MGMKELVQLRLAEALVGLEEAALQTQVAGRGNDWPGVAAWAHLSMRRAAALAELMAIESQSEAMRRARGPLALRRASRRRSETPAPHRRWGSGTRGLVGRPRRSLPGLDPDAETRQGAGSNVAKELRGKVVAFSAGPV